MPTLMQLAPASMSAFAPSAVATLPAMTRACGYLDLIVRRQSMMFLLWPCAESSTRMSACASMSADAPRVHSRRADGGGAHSGAALVARGQGIANRFSMSLMVTGPLACFRNPQSKLFDFIAIRSPAPARLWCPRRVTSFPLS
jgi:hypothetical protein